MGGGGRQGDHLGKELFQEHRRGRRKPDRGTGLHTETNKTVQEPFWNRK